jgi:hypothetical protein
MDYRVRHVAQHGFRVSRLQVVGIAAEQFLHLGYHQKRIGVGSLQWCDIGHEVRLYDVLVDGRKRKEVSVQVPREDAELALKVAQHLAFVLRQQGFVILDAIVDEEDDTGTCVGQHDAVCERYSSQSVLAGHHSVELKLKHIKKEYKREDFRQQMRQQAMKLWKSMLLQNGQYSWRSRMIVLFEFGSPMDLEWKAVRGDIIGLGAADWQSLFGWPGSSSSAGQPKMLPLRPAPCLTRPRRKRPFEQLGLQDVAGVKRPFEDLGLEWVTVSGKPMASVSALLTAMKTPAAKKAKGQVGERLKKWWPKKFVWDRSDIGTHASARSSHGGGSDGHVAAENVLRDIYSLY